jgi:hypothetical protein
LPAEIRFYLDENVETAIAEQLILSGIDTVTVRDIQMLGKTDTEQLRKAWELGRVLCTYVEDFIRLHKSGIDHAGLITGKRTKHGIGDWVKFLKFVHQVLSAEDMKNHLEYV